MSLLVLLEGPASGSATLAEADELLASAVAVLVQASSALAEVDDSLTAAGALLVSATAALGEADEMVGASAVVLVVATADITEADDALQASVAMPLVETATPYPVRTRRKRRPDYDFLNPEFHRERVELGIEAKGRAELAPVAKPAEAKQAKKPGPGYADALEVLLGSAKLRAPVPSAPAALPATRDAELSKQEVEELRDLVQLEMRRQDEEDEELLLLLAASVAHVHHGPPARTVIPR